MGRAEYRRYGSKKFKPTILDKNKSDKTNSDRNRKEKKNWW